MTTTTSYEVTTIDPYGKVIKGIGGIPLDDFLAISKTMGNDAVMLPSVCKFYGAITALAHSQKIAKEWEEYIEEELKRLYPEDPHQRWERGTDTGISSMTMFFALKKGITYPKAEVPRDMGDFGRCYRLIERFPEWKEELHKVSDKNPKWKNIIDNWDKLCKSYEDEDKEGLRELLKV